MSAGSLFESVPNFSEGVREDVIAALAEVAAGAHVLDTDPDPDHNRVVISMAANRAKLADALVATVGVAVDRIDVREHRGVHPRIGAADVVPIVPLGNTTLASCRELAHELGDRIWSELKVPVYFYGEGRSLADIRAGRGKPDLGGPDLHPTAGAVCVGARTILVAFNVLLPDSDLAGARALARSLRESAGGMRGVQALAFQLPGDLVQLSMNLFRLDEASPEAVVGELARRRVAVGAQQVVGLCPAIAANAAAAGRLLEARLAAVSARAGASRCQERGGEEHLALARRLRREAEQIAMLGVAQDDLLAGAERAAAMVQVLRAADVLDDEIEGMLNAAATGLRAAIWPDTQAVYSARITALDRRLTPR